MGLAVKKIPGLENKNITCPVCKQSSPYSKYKLVSGGGDSKDETVYPKSGEDKTDINKDVNYIIGCLNIPGKNTPCSLKLGKNVIGREANSSSADIKVPCEGKNRMSREHIVIEVKKVPGKGYVHYVSMYKEKLNAKTSFVWYNDKKTRKKEEPSTYEHQTKTEKRWENFLIALIMFIGGLLHSSAISFFNLCNSSSVIAKCLTHLYCAIAKFDFFTNIDTRSTVTPGFTWNTANGPVLSLITYSNTAAFNISSFCI